MRDRHSRTVEVFGIQFTCATPTQLAEEVCRPLPANSGVHLLVTANLDHIVKLRQNAEFRKAYKNAWTATIDGTPVLLYARARSGFAANRITGADLFPQIMERLQTTQHRPFFVVSSQIAADRIAEWLVQRGFDPNAVATDVPPRGFELNLTYSEKLARRIRDHNTTHLFFGVGCPKSEIWIDANREELGDLFAFAFGAGLDFFAGVTKRAPAILRVIGLEWLWRVLQDPRRLFRRYFIDSWPFVAAVWDDLTRSRNSAEQGLRVARGSKKA